VKCKLDIFSSTAPQLYLFERKKKKYNNFKKCKVRVRTWRKCIFVASISREINVFHPKPIILGRQSYKYFVE
jgi:predicted nucleic acid-binding OB-fold protein